MVGSDLRLQGNSVAVWLISLLRDKERGVRPSKRFTRHRHLRVQRGCTVYHRRIPGADSKY